MIENFFQELDRAWKPMGLEPIRLPVMGSSAIFLQCEYDRGTKDSDILEIEEIPARKELLKLAGKGSAFAAKQRLYLELIKAGLPFLPPRAVFHPLDSLNTRLKNFKIETLDIVDVVVSKLKPFRIQDRDDIQAVIGLGLVEPDRLLERFHKAKEQWLMGSRAKELPGYIENLQMVERDWLRVPESKIELPRYIFE